MISVGLADDHRMVREGLEALLSREADIQVVGVADNGRDAVLLARDKRPDVMVLDASMPELNGIDACRLITEQTTCRVVALSMHGEAQFVRAMLGAGAMGYVLKEAEPAELIDAIHEVAAGRRYVSPALSDQILGDYSERLARETQSAGDELSPRHRQVLQLLAEGRSTKEIAAALHLSARTVETYRAQIANQTGYHSLAELTKLAIRLGLTSLDE